MLRIMQSADLPVFVAYRNDPELAKYQLWDLPYTEDAAAFVRDQDGWTDLQVGGWTQIAVERDGTQIGDVCCHVDETGSLAQVGFTLTREAWGHGYASEAALALVTDLVDRIGVVRLMAELDPANVASQRVLESIGLVHESDAKRAYLWRGEWTDNMTYAITADEWRAWRDRPTGPPAEVELVEITAEDQRGWRNLETHWSQRRLVSPVFVSYGDALFPPAPDGERLRPVLRGILADGQKAGFVMYAEPTAAEPTPYLWRFLVDRRFQGRGIGARALQLLMDQWRSEGHQSVLLSFGDGPGSPRGFYERLGAVPTGDMDEDEIVARITL